MAKDEELEGMIAANRRGAGLRLLVVGFVIAAVGGGVAWYGHQLEVEQRHSQVQFVMPKIFELFGAAAVVVGLLLIALCLIQLVRR